MSSVAFYARFQEELAAWAERVPDIQTILVVGSRARLVKPADEYSDLDVALFMADNRALGDDIIIQWLRDLAPIWIIVEEHRDEAQCWLILYQGGIKVDLAVMPVTALQPLIDERRLWDDQQRGYTILYDKAGVAAQLPPATPLESPPYTPPTEEQLVKRVEGYFYGAVYIAKQIRRGNLWKVKWADQIQQTMMLDMLEWHAHASHTGPIDTYYRGDFMRDWVSESTWHALHNVFAHFDASDSRDALLASVRLFSRLAQETAAQLGYRLPLKMMAEVTDYITSLGLP